MGLAINVVNFDMIFQISFNPDGIDTVPIFSFGIQAQPLSKQAIEEVLDESPEKIVSSYVNPCFYTL